MWTKDTTPNPDTITFDYDLGWPAPGFRLNYGRIIRNYDVPLNDFGNHLLIEADGTRTPLISQSSNLYRSQDGRYIELNTSNNNYKLNYPDGTEVAYIENGNKLVPNKIKDINGNSVTINYVANCNDTPRIPSAQCVCNPQTCVRAPRQAIKNISDTLGRLVSFYYYADGNLAEIKVPGYNGQPDRPLVKSYYLPHTISTNFAATLTRRNVPSGSYDALRRVYFPDTGRGYVFDEYSGYGMFSRVSMRLGMTDTTDGTEVAYTKYIHQTTGTLSDAPQFTQRQEWWLGKTDDNGTPQDANTPSLYDYSRTDTVTTRTSTITALADGTQTQMISNKDAASAVNGTLTTHKVIGATTLFQQDYSYTSSSQSGLQRTQITTVQDGFTATESKMTMVYSDFGRLMEQIEFGYRISGAFKKRRRTTYRYLGDPANPNDPYIIKGLLRLVDRIEVFDALETDNDNDDVKIARTEYVYDCADCPTPDPDWRIETYGFTDNCSPPACTPPPGYNTNFVSRTERGNVTKVKLWTENLNGSTPQITFRRRYDIFGNLVKAEASCCALKTSTFTSWRYYAFPAAVSDTDTGATITLSTSYAYDLNTGFLTSQTDPDGLVTSFEPDAAMRLKKITYPKLAADANPNPTLETFFPPDPNYAGKDGLLHQSKLTYREDSTQKVVITNQWLDGAGRVARTGSAAGPTVSSYDAVKTIYDALGRVRKTTNPYNTTASDGDTAGLPHPTVYSYDGLGRVTTLTLPDGQAVATAYGGAVVTVTDQVGRQRQSEVDGLGRVIKVTEAVGQTNWETTYAYDKLDNLTSVNQGGQMRTYKYDALSRLTHERTPEQGALSEADGAWSLRYTYESFGAVKTRKDARAVITTYGYDGLNRLQGISYNTTGTTATATTNIGITYKPTAPGKGQVSQVTDGAGTEDYAYDTLARAQSKTRTIDSQSYPVTYEYNQVGQATAMIYPSGKRVRMNHDSRGRLSGVERTTGGTLAYLSGVTYNPAQQVTQLHLSGTALRENYTYAADRLQLSGQSVTRTGDSAQLLNLDYSYQASATTGGGTQAGNSGQLMAVTGASRVNGALKDEAFTYDAVGRLTSRSGWGAGNRRFTYDRYGNRSAVRNSPDGVSGQQIQTAALDQPGGVANNRLVSVTTTSGNTSTPRTYTYDTNGNLTSDGVHAYKYDAANRLTIMDEGLSTQASYFYDAANRRVKRVTPSGTTYYVWEGMHVIAEYTTGERDGGGVRYYHADRLSTRLITDSGGNVKGAQDHLSFGEDAGVIGEGEKHRFTSYERDGESGTDYAINRQYSQSTGRFMQTDPIAGRIGDPQSLNRYGYTTNDPINFTDPLGLIEEDCPPGTTFVPGFGCVPDDPNPITSLRSCPAGYWYDPFSGLCFREDYVSDGSRPFQYRLVNFYRDFGGLDIRTLQTGLDVIGLIPGAELADACNALISLAQGDNAGAGLSAAAIIPIAGWGATAAKFGRQATRFVSNTTVISKGKTIGTGTVDLGSTLEWGSYFQALFDEPITAGKLRRQYALNQFLPQPAKPYLTQAHTSRCSSLVYLPPLAPRHYQCPHFHYPPVCQSHGYQQSLHSCRIYYPCRFQIKPPSLVV